MKDNVKQGNLCELSATGKARSPHNHNLQLLL